MSDREMLAWFGQDRDWSKMTPAQVRRATVAALMWFHTLPEDETENCRWGRWFAPRYSVPDPETRAFDFLLERGRITSIGRCLWVLC